MTLRSTAYIVGSLSALGIVPIIGTCAALIWGLILLPLALAAAHKVDSVKAFTAVGIGFVLTSVILLGAIFVLALAAGALLQALLPNGIK